MEWHQTQSPMTTRKHARITRLLNYIENNEVSLWQDCLHWWHWRLSWWQPTVTPMTKKLALWQHSVFSVCTQFALCYCCCYCCCCIQVPVEYTLCPHWNGNVDICITCIRSCRNDKFLCSWWWKFHQNGDIFFTMFRDYLIVTCPSPSVAIPGLFLGLRPANERRCYKVTPSLIG